MGDHKVSNLLDIAVYNLGHTQLSIVRNHVEGLGLDASRSHGLPFQIVSSEFGIGSRLCFLSDRLDGRRAIDGLLGAGDIGQPEEVLATWRGGNRKGLLSHCCLAQLNMVVAVTVGEEVCRRLCSSRCNKLERGVDGDSYSKVVRTWTWVLRVRCQSPHFTAGGVLQVRTTSQLYSP